MLAYKFTRSCVVLAVVLQATVVFAQRGGRQMPPSYYQPVPPFSPELGFSYDHASTAFEGALRGQAQLTYAAGAYDLAVSQSLICREEARLLAQVNRERWLMKRRAFRDGLEQRRQIRIEQRRMSNEVMRPKRYEVYRLTAKQLDRATGAIVWPAVLLRAEHGVARERLCELFRDDARDAGSLAERTAEVVDCVRMISNTLLRNRASVTPTEYLAAKKFLCGLTHEAEYPLDNVRRNGTQTAANAGSTMQRTSPWENN